MLKAYIEGHFMVAVTCVIRGDGRLSYAASPQASFTRLRSRVVDQGFERFQYRDRRHQNSHLNVQETDPDPQYEGRDDGEALEEFGKREAQILAGDTVSGSVEVFWSDRTYRLGNVQSGAVQVIQAVVSGLEPAPLKTFTLNSHDDETGQVTFDFTKHVE